MSKYESDYMHFTNVKTYLFETTSTRPIKIYYYLNNHINY